MTDDIVDTLRRNPLYIPTSRINSFGRPQMGFELTSFNLIASDEIERLRKERDEARREAMSWFIDQACRSEDVDEEYKKRGWEYLKENTDGR
jgi:hypothetical protein